MGNNFSLHSISFETFASLSSGSTPGFHPLACCHLKSISVMQKLCLIGLLAPRAQHTTCISTDLPMPIKDGAPCCITLFWNRRASLLGHRAGQQIGLQFLTSSGWQSNLGADIEEVIIGSRVNYIKYFSSLHFEGSFGCCGSVKDLVEYRAAGKALLKKYSRRSPGRLCTQRVLSPGQTSVSTQASLNESIQ